MIGKWLPEVTTPGLRQAVEVYLKQTQALADRFTLLVAEALDLNPALFTRVLQRESSYSILRICAYPEPESSHPADTGFQGVGPHKDGSFMTYLLQGTDHCSLEVQNKSGLWISVPPVPNTLVVNIGQSLEALTQGVCVATTHRVHLRSMQYHGTYIPLGTRLSFAFFQMLALDVTQEDMLLELPSHIMALREKHVKSDAETFFADLYKGPSGQAILINIITSYPDFGRRWYPELLDQVLKQQHESKRLDDIKLCRETKTNYVRIST